MRKETHFKWRTAYGWCYRFARQNAPNLIVGRTIWPHTLNQEMVEAGQDKDADIVAAQLDAWGWSTTGISFLDEPAVKLAGTYLIPIWRTARQKIMAVDCGFGGGDPATFTALESGEVDLPDDFRQPVSKPVMGGLAQEVLPVTGDFEFSAEWYEHMLGLFDYTGGNFPESIRIAPFQVGQLIPASYQLAQLVIERAIDLQIPPGNITFDSSQRGDCTNIMLACLGRQNIRYYYEGTRSMQVEEELTPGWYIWPFEYERTDANGNKLPKKWSELCSRPISMMWMFACNFIRHGGVVNGQVLKRGLEELIARPIETSKRGHSYKRDVMSKAEIKAAGMKSPTWGEGLAMAIYFGVRFLGVVPIGRPELTTMISGAPAQSEIIRAHKSIRFRPDASYFNHRRS
jgi:hypothetical protein